MCFLTFCDLDAVELGLNNLFLHVHLCLGVSRKRMKALDNLVALSQSSLLDDPQSVTLQDNVEKLRAKFRQVSSLCSSVAPIHFLTGSGNWFYWNLMWSQHTWCQTLPSVFQKLSLCQQDLYKIFRKSEELSVKTSYKNKQESLTVLEQIIKGIRGS